MKADKARAFLAAYDARSSGFENPSADLVAAMSGYDEALSSSGVYVNERKALRVIAVYAAVRVIAESIGSLPLPIYERQGRSRLRVNDDPRDWILNEEPNALMSASALWETWLGHALLWGNGYIARDLDGRGMVSGLYPLDPTATTPVVDRAGRNLLGYLSRTPNGEDLRFGPGAVIHLRAFGTSPVGISPIGVARQTIGEALAAEEYAGRFWQNDGRPGGVVEFDGRLSEEQHSTILKRWNAAHQGVRKSHLVAILDNGATWRDVGIPMKDAQFLDSRKWGNRQIASLYRVPPHKIGDLEGTITYASIESQEIAFATDTLRPWVVRMEQALRRGLFGHDSDRARGLYPEFKIDAILRGDTKTRYEAYAIGRQWGFMSIDDVLEMENRPVIGADKGGEDYLVPLNMAPAGSPPPKVSQDSVDAAAQAAREFLASVENAKRGE